MPKDILKLEECEDIFFSEEGMRISTEPRAWATDSQGIKWVQHNGKRCLMRPTIQAYSGPIPYRRSGRD